MSVFDILTKEDIGKLLFPEGDIYSEKLEKKSKEYDELLEKEKKFNPSTDKSKINKFKYPNYYNKEELIEIVKLYKTMLKTDITDNQKELIYKFLMWALETMYIIDKEMIKKIM